MGMSVDEQIQDPTAVQKDALRPKRESRHIAKTPNMIRLLAEQVPVAV